MLEYRLSVCVLKYTVILYYILLIYWLYVYNGGEYVHLHFQSNNLQDLGSNFNLFVNPMDSCSSCDEVLYEMKAEKVAA